MYSEILKTVKSGADRELLLSEIEELQKSLFETNKGGLDNVLKNSVRESIASLLKKEIEKTESVSKYLEGLVQKLNSLDELKITMAIEPTEAIIDAIYSWLSGNSKENIILDIDIDPTLIAGAKVSYKGKYYDGSLARII